MLKIRNLAKQYIEKNGNRIQAVDDLSFSLGPGKLLTLLGPSGCGKSTTLRCVAGLIKPDNGVILIDNQEVFSMEKHINLPPYDRKVGMVFQSYAIWPHMDVFDNVAFPLKVSRKRFTSKAIREKVYRQLEMMGMAHLAQRPSTDLSGGQQQRLALARGLVQEPKVLLLDEPLSNLDAKLRKDMRVQLKKLQVELGITALYVTHDQAEALILSDVIAVMKDGKIEQLGPPREIYEQPRTRFVAEFVGETNLIPGKVIGKIHERNNEYLAVATKIGKIHCPGNRHPRNPQVFISIRPEYISISSAYGSPEQPNTFRGMIKTRMFLGDRVELEVDLHGTTLWVQAHPDGGMENGMEIRLHLPMHRCIVLQN